MGPSGGGVKAKDKFRFGSTKVSPLPTVNAEEVAAAAAAKGKKSRAKKAASRIDLDKAESLAFEAKMKAREAARVAKAKAEEAEEAARIAKAKAEEAEEAARAAKADAEAAAKAIEAAEEARLLYEKEMEWAQCEEELDASMFRGRWNQQHARHGATFPEITSIPPMRYTYPTPEEKVYIKTAETLQIVSLKIVSINDDSLRWPLQVFGMVAVRDILDHKRNIIFQRQRNNCQIINKNDPYLALTGPSRAVAVSMEPSHIEVSLKVKGTTKSDDKDLSELVLNFRSGCVLSDVYPSRISTIEFKYDHIMCAVEATIRIKVTGGSWPDGFRGMFTAYNTRADDLKVKLLDFGDGGLPVGADGMVKLSRSVVSVGLEEMLKVSAMAYPINDDEVADSSEVALKPEMAGITPPGFVLTVGSCSMEVSVAWSLFRRRF
ncbi:hypothetical protein VPH35_134160 [Triticum aestivum]|uniref:DUF6598 domain-containing protein n=1 Tax=Triticum aestivum TaxID=4565 RepID=A0A3B6TGY9_WHEAT